MEVSDFYYGCARGVGKVIGGSVRAVTSVGRVVSESLGKLRPMSSIEKIRQIVLTELRRLRGKELDLNSLKLEERIEIMAQTILALQQKIDELGDRGSVSEATVMEAMDSVKVAESLNDDERSLLVTVFQRNISLQKPELVGAIVGAGAAG